MSIFDVHIALPYILLTKQVINEKNQPLTVIVSSCVFLVASHLRPCGFTASSVAMSQRDWAPSCVLSSGSTPAACSREGEVLLPSYLRFGSVSY